MSGDLKMEPASGCLIGVDTGGTFTDIVFLDPPYALMEDEKTRASVLEQAVRTRELFADSGFLVLRSPILWGEDGQKLEGFNGPEVHKFTKSMFVLLYSPRPST